jgi:hypothetical protein
VPPLEGGNRWGFSALLRPDATAAESLDAVAREAADVAGGGHWLTGAAASSHLTLRALEPWREAIDADDPLVRRYCAALETATDGIKPLIFQIVGLTLTPSSVLACAVPSGGDADRMAGAFAAALGADGWYEREFVREFWYLTLVHFADVIEKPARLVEWVGARRTGGITTVHVDEVELAQWCFAGDGVVPRPVVATSLV